MSKFAIINNPRLRRETPEQAVREIEICPASPTGWAVAVYADDGRELGYAYREGEVR